MSSRTSLLVAANRLRAVAFVAATLVGASIVFGACDEGQSAVTGLDEPIIVSGAQFISGDLPGVPPVAEGDAEAAPATNGAGFPPLTVAAVTVVGPNVPVGLTGKSLKGDVSADAVAVAVRLLGMGTGYWVVPVGSLDTSTPGAAAFSMSAGFNPDDAPGLHTLRFVAIGPTGQGGTQFDLPDICVNSRIPDNGHACAPDVAPAPAVMTLEWDTNFDVDLQVVTPDGTNYNPKMRVGEPLDAGTHAIPPDQPFIDRDSLRSCVPDGLRQEDLIFPVPLAKGKYEIYADPYAACGQNAAHFKFTVYQTIGTCPACNLQPTLTRSGELGAAQVTGGTAPPLFVDELVVN